ncbi:MAG: hypothetical protein PCFJNLEI_02729 [Verrucomicrobiae bacterium]|nr:hypothetical protein [Verrucomicrobiae bacterium]
MRTVRQLLKSAVVGLLALSVVGCAHNLEVKNLNAYRNVTNQPLLKPAVVGITTTSGDFDSRRIIRAVTQELARYSAETVFPYAPAGAKPVDIIANIDVKPQYYGSGVNFLISWPGFLIFTPAWNGYVYTVKFDVTVSLVKSVNGEQIDQFTVPLNLNVRHADINRTWVEGAGWFFWTTPALVGAFFHIQYDDNVTTLLLNKAEVPLADYIAQEIVVRINKSGKFTKIQRNGIDFYFAGLLPVEGFQLGGNPPMF